MTAPLIALGAFNEMAASHPIKPSGGTKPSVAKPATGPTLDDYQHARDLVVADEARRNGVSPHLAVAIARVENAGGQPWLVSPTGDVGLMQVNPRAHNLQASELVDPRINAREGTRILGAYIQRYGDLDTALRAYNGSLRNKSRGDQYVAKVKAALKDISGNQMLHIDIRGLTPSDRPQPPDAYVQALHDYEEVAFSGRFTPEMIAEQKKRFNTLTTHMVARRTAFNEQASRQLPARTQAQRPQKQVAPTGGVSAEQ